MHLQQLQQTHFWLSRDAQGLCIWLMIFAALMLWLWQISYGTFARGEIGEQFALFTYGLVLVSIPLLLLRWVDLEFSPRIFVCIAVVSILLLHVTTEEGPSIAGLMYMRLGMPSVATFLLATLASIRLLGNKPWLLLPDQLRGFSIGVFACLVVHLFFEHVLLHWLSSDSVLDAMFGLQTGVALIDNFASDYVATLNDEKNGVVVFWLNGVWVAGCVLFAVLCQWRGQSLCALWLSLTLICWSLDGGNYRSDSFAVVSPGASQSENRLHQSLAVDDALRQTPGADCGERGPAKAQQAFFRIDARSSSCVRVFSLSGHARPLVDGKPIVRDPYPYPSELLRLDLDRGGGAVFFGDWLTDWFVAICALLWLLRVAEDPRKRKARKLHRSKAQTSSRA